MWQIINKWDQWHFIAIHCLTEWHPDINFFKGPLKLISFSITFHRIWKTILRLDIGNVVQDFLVHLSEEHIITTFKEDRIISTLIDEATLHWPNQMLSPRIIYQLKRNTDLDISFFVSDYHTAKGSPAIRNSAVLKIPVFNHTSHITTLPCLPWTTRATQKDNYIPFNPQSSAIQGRFQI